jgi:hypothetical protein
LKGPRISLWRNIPVAPIGFSENREDCLSPDGVQPSGRQALIAAIRRLGLSRSNLVAIPEWSSACVIEAIGRYATPIPVTLSLKNKIQVHAVVVYEQWGWPLPESTLAEIQSAHSGAPIILDKVDSAPLMMDRHISAAEIWSLSKVLGLSGGGLLRIENQWIGCQESQEDKSNWKHLERMDDKALARDISKSHIAYLPDSTRKFIEKADLAAAYDAEALHRQGNLDVLGTLIAADGWNAWMQKALAQGGAPGIAPLFRGQSSQRLNTIAKAIFCDHGIEAIPYRFNYSANTLISGYEPCLAFPVHGQVSPEFLVEALAPWQ